MRAIDYLEVVVDPAFNLPEVSHITKTPVQIMDIIDGDTDDRSVSVTKNFNRCHTRSILPWKAGIQGYRILGCQRAAA
ncbi:MAG: hypothetical protein ABW201_14255 [Candidatus Thiodiazotropha sp.]